MQPANNNPSAKTEFWRYIPPNAITCLSLSVALISIGLSFSGYLATAAWCILYCTILDKLDGFAARLCKATSAFGVELDSFVDFAAFGIAPAALAWNSVVTIQYETWTHPMTYIALLYSIATVIRLVRFNTTQSKLPDNLFIGTPSTLAGGIIASLFLCLLSYNWLNDFEQSWVMMLSLLILGVLMLLPISMIKVGASKNKATNTIIYLAVIIAYACVIFNKFPIYILLMGICYILVGFIMTRFKITSY